MGRIASPFCFQDTKGMKTQKAQAILSLSGGLDSAVLCAALREKGGEISVLPVFFRYGSKHNPREEKAARAVAVHFALELSIIDLRAAFAGISSALLTIDPRPIPRVEYSSESMGLTLVPGRNLIFASVLAGMAESAGIPSIALATHGGDHHLYPDCRPEFNEALAGVVACGSGGRVTVATPFASLNKMEIVRLGMRLDAPFHLTRSCYEAEEQSCGLCGTCIERLAAFEANGIADPIAYISSEKQKKEGNP